jgi:DNA-binding NtrC family response regulator
VATFHPEVVVCDPDAVRARRIQAALSASSHVVCHEQLSDVRHSCQSGSASIVLLPFGMADARAPEDAAVLELLRTFARHLPALVYADTARLPINVYCQPLAAGARQILNAQAPTFLEDLTAVVERLTHDIRAQFQERENLGKLLADCGLIANSAAMRDVFRRVLKASHFSDLPVLLLGETGTGKQRVAEAIHALDPCRRDKPFITINCSALSKTLAESELFGHSRGAFSGAAGERKGLFRAANGGTLMLDEIGELDLELQPKLLRVLQERRLLPVGEDYEHHIDVRIIAATNRPLDAMIDEGRFREDLYQRLNVFRVQLPPLRERPEDIDLQARHFLERYQAGRPDPVIGFGPRVMEALQSLPWEGNTRQLENLIREVLAHRTGTGAWVEMADLPRWVFEKLAAAPLPDVPPPEVPLDRHVEEAYHAGTPLAAAVEEYERRLLERVLRETGGNRTRAAQRLGLTPRTVFAKIKKYQLD